jgi:hypothetical protein
MVIPIVGAVAVVAALALAGYMLLTSNSSDTETTSPGSSTTPTVNPTGSDSASGDPSSTASGDPSGSGTPTGTDKPTGTGKPTSTDKATDKPTKQPTKNSDAPVPQIPVYVFNQTGLTGLASNIGAQLDAAGWNVVGIDNWRGTVPEDTVYYYPGDQAAAERLSEDFPDIGRVWPASAPMPAGALTVILASTDRK